MTKCECGHSVDEHVSDDGFCYVPLCGCAEFSVSDACSHCGEAHDPDVSADIAEEATW